MDGVGPISACAHSNELQGVPKEPRVTDLLNILMSTLLSFGIGRIFIMVYAERNLKQF